MSDELIDFLCHLELEHLERLERVVETWDSSDELSDELENLIPIAKKTRQATIEDCRRKCDPLRVSQGDRVDSWKGE